MGLPEFPGRDGRQRETMGDNHDHDGTTKFLDSGLSRLTSLVRENIFVDKLMTVQGANKTATDSTSLVKLTDTSTSVTTELIPTVSIPSNTTLEVLAGQKYILEAGDILKIKAGHASTIDVTIGVLEIS